jgi:hypothetical protein
MKKWTAFCLVVVLALGGCGDSARLSAAVQAVDPKLRSFYAHSYAGLEVQDDRLIIYRKPDAALDTAVREQLDDDDDVDVDAEFRDAPYALDTLQPLADRVNGDRHHWITRDFPVTLAVPRADGRGVNVFVATKDFAAARAEFRQEYGDEPIVVDRPTRTGIVPVG